MNVLLAGAGQLGSRHLQAIALLDDVKTVYVIEPSHESRERAATRFKEVPGHATKQLVFTSFEALQNEKPSIDAAVIASPASGRLDVLRNVLALNVRRILCEKIAFQSVALYQQALALQAKTGAHIYLNHIYRYIPVYGYLRSAIARAGVPVAMQLHGGNLGLGSNLIHFLDLFSFVASAPVTLQNVTIDLPLLPNKRGDDLIECSGSATATAEGGHTFELLFEPGELVVPCITCTYGDTTTRVDEVTGIVTSNDAKATTLAAVAPRVSELTAQIIREMINGTPLLPMLEESFSMNAQMLRMLNQRLGLGEDDATLCPIT